MTKESIYTRKEFNSHSIGLGRQHGRRVIVLGHQYGPVTSYEKALFQLPKFVGGGGDKGYYGRCAESIWSLRYGMDRRKRTLFGSDGLTKEWHFKSSMFVLITHLVETSDRN